MEGINDLKLIKKHYNEKMAHLCRELFPTILEKPGLLYELLTKNFEPSKFLYEDLTKYSDLVDKFKNYIYSLINIDEEEKEEVIKNPFELLKEAGYTLYECKTEEDIQQFRHYYYRLDGTPTPEYKGGRPEYYKPEELCTFGGDRLNRCHVFFAVKEGAENLVRTDFEHPERQDEYGTSVISIQFTRGSVNTVSIKNRYNHTVNDPDATFSNNLDNIVPGLTESFKKTYNFDSKSDKNVFSMRGYIRANDGKFYKYNREDNNVYYCPNNVIIDNFVVKHYDPTRYIVFNEYILDLQKKEISQYKNMIKDSFPETIKDIKIVEQSVDKQNSERTITINGNIVIKLNKYNQIIEYTNPIATTVGSNFMYADTTLRKLSLPNVESVKFDFLRINDSLWELDLPKVKQIGDNFLTTNNCLASISLPEVEHIGARFLYANRKLRFLDLPKVRVIGNGFIKYGGDLDTISLPNVEKVGNIFLHDNYLIRHVDLPKLEYVGDEFLFNNKRLYALSLPSLKKACSCFLYHNSGIRFLTLPNLETIYNSFLASNEKIDYLDLPKVTIIRDNFLCRNTDLIELNLPNVEIIGSNCLEKNGLIQRLNVPKARTLFIRDFMDKPLRYINGIEVDGSEDIASVLITTTEENGFGVADFDYSDNENSMFL